KPVIDSGQVPVLETGNGSGVVHVPTLCTTVGGNPCALGTSIDAHGVVAVTVRLMVGVLGSSVGITRVHDLRTLHGVVGVYRMTRCLPEAWLTSAGKGLLINVKSAQAGSNAADTTCRLYFPTLHTEIVFSGCAPPHTWPKLVEPVTRPSPGG